MMPFEKADDWKGGFKLNVTLNGFSPALEEVFGLALLKKFVVLSVADVVLNHYPRQFRRSCRENDDAHLNSFKVDMSSIDSIVKFERSFNVGSGFKSASLSPALNIGKSSAKNIHDIAVLSLNSAVDPGVVQTRIMREIPVSLSRLAFAVLKFLRLLQSPEVGVSSIIDAALAPPKTSGEYFFGGMGGKIKSSSLSYNPELAAELWLKSSMLFQKQMNELQVRIGGKMNSASGASSSGQICCPERQRQKLVFSVSDLTDVHRFFWLVAPHFSPLLMMHRRVASLAVLS
ncbi:hypothetical protein KSP40_PGU022480 [Platanthera guangdongensis]|uniref:Uncharacterized protein n=1 Tax=Platanthera guangdongensis TaxID=2320717 RepID=A0ABR2M3W4_9ASPA